MVLYSLAIDSPFIYAAKLGKKAEQTIFFFIILNKTPFFFEQKTHFWVFIRVLFPLSLTFLRLNEIPFAFLLLNTRGVGPVLNK